MEMFMDWQHMIDTVVCGDARTVLAGFPDDTIQTCITSPPYLGLRSYTLDPTIWGGDPECKHAWGDTTTKRNRWGLDKDASDKQCSNRGNAWTINQGAFCHKCGAWCGELGHEPTPELYVEHLVQIFQEVRRVLRPDGTLWLNIGDSYNNNNGFARSTGTWARDGRLGGAGDKRVIKHPSIKPKDQMLVPFRVALALQADGWWVRSTIIWHKPNAFPESVTDRPTTDFEYIFLLTKQAKYYYDLDAIREPYTQPLDRWGGDTLIANGYSTWDAGTGQSAYRHRNMRPDPRGRNKRTVWSINLTPYKDAHFATFPPALIEPMVLAGSSSKTCPKCGQPWVRVVKKATVFEGGSGKAGRTAAVVNSQGKWAGVQYGTNIKLGPTLIVETLGFRPSCDCYDGRYQSDLPRTRNSRKRQHQDVAGSWLKRAKRQPGLDTWDVERPIVLDPFAGSGTTCAVARRLQRHFIGIDASPQYCQMAQKRIANTFVQYELF